VESFHAPDYNAFVVFSSVYQVACNLFHAKICILFVAFMKFALKTLNLYDSYSKKKVTKIVTIKYDEYHSAF
jgi:hypothetical protein